jgi:hypothetical protein
MRKKVCFRVSCIQVLLSALMLAFSLKVPVFYLTIGRIGMEVSWNGACTRQRKGFPDLLEAVVEGARFSETTVITLLLCFLVLS